MTELGTYSEKWKDIRWLKKRERILDRDMYHCVRCSGRAVREGLL